MKKLTAMDLVKLGVSPINARFFAGFCYQEDVSEFYHFIESTHIGAETINFADIISIQTFGDSEKLVAYIEADMAELYGPAIEDNMEQLKKEAQLLKIAMLQEELHREQEELKALNGSEAAA